MTPSGPAARLGAEPHGREHRPQHDPHLEQREAGAEAAPDPGGERHPLEWPRRIFPQEALGPEREWVWIEVGAAVEQVDRGRHVDAGRQLPAAELQRGLQAPGDERDYGSQPQRLLDHGVQVRTFPGALVVEKLGERARVRLRSSIVNASALAVVS